MSRSKRIGFVDANGMVRVHFDDTTYAITPDSDLAQTVGKYNYRFLVNDFPPSLAPLVVVGGTALVSSVAETSLWTGGTKKGAGTPGTIPAGYLNRIGACLQFRCRGTVANTSTPTLQLQLKAGAAGTTVIADTTARATAAITGTSPWLLDALLTVLTTGATGTVRVQGQFTYFTTGPVGVNWSITDAGAITLDLTVAQVLALTGTWGTSSASNTISHTNSLITGA